MRGRCLLAKVVLQAGLTLLASSGCRDGDEGTPAPTAPGAAKAGDGTAPPPQTAPGTGPGMAALTRAAAGKKYLFVFFCKDESQQTQALRAVFDAATAKVSDRADAVAVNVADPAEKDIVAKFEANRAPLPLVLALAPNGAITGGFPRKFEEKDLLNAFATPCTEQCMKSLQSGRLVVLCVQNETTWGNDPARRAARDFQADARFSEATDVVTLDPVDPAEASFLADLKIDPKAAEAVTILMAPPGSVLGEFTGAVGKADLVSALEKASSACAGGSCGPGGCGPRK